MARKTAAETKAEKLAQLEALKAEIEAIEDKEAKRLGRLAIKAGLSEIKVSDADLLAALKDLAGRFHGSSKKPASPVQAPAPESRKASEPGDVGQP